MKILLKILLLPFELIALLLIYIYKFAISPILPHTCRYTPSCSTYAVTAIRRFGIFYGIILSAKRICRCNPWTKGESFDPVPQNIKGEMKWLI